MEHQPKPASLHRVASKWPDIMKSKITVISAKFNPVRFRWCCFEQLFQAPVLPMNKSACCQEFAFSVAGAPPSGVILKASMAPTVCLYDLGRPGGVEFREEEPAASSVRQPWAKYCLGMLGMLGQTLQKSIYERVVTRKTSHRREIVFC